MATECAQVVTLTDKQKTVGKSVPPAKNICQPFTLRLILGVPILKEDSKNVNDLETLFAKFTRTDASSSSQPGSDRDIFWDHVVIGVNSIVKQMEDAARDTTLASKSMDPFLVILLDFAWLNSQLGHHLAHLCSGTPHTSLVAVSPPGKLSKLVSAPLQNVNSSTPKVACVGIRPLMMPHTSRLPGLRDFLRACASLTGKPLPIDPAASTAANAGATAAALAAGGVDGASLAGLAAATPQYVPILPKPPTSILIPASSSNAAAASLGMMEMTSPTAASGVMAAAGIPGGYMVTPGGGATSLISSSVADMGWMVTTPRRQMSSARVMLTHPGSSQTPLQKPQIPPKPPVPRPAVRHIPADDWLTYKLDHAKLYKCGADISKELENHSLYIHDVADIWALYPRQFQNPDIVMRRHAPPPSSNKPSSGGASGSSSGHHYHHKGGSRCAPPPTKQRRGTTGLPAPPPHHHLSPQDYFDEEEEDEEADVEDEDDYGYGAAGTAGASSSAAAYLDSPTRHHYSRHSSSGGGLSRGMYRKSQATAAPPPEPPSSSSSYAGVGKSRRRRTSPRW